MQERCKLMAGRFVCLWCSGSFHRLLWGGFPDGEEHGPALQK